MWVWGELHATIVNVMSSDLSVHVGVLMSRGVGDPLSARLPAHQPDLRRWKHAEVWRIRQVTAG